MTAPEGSQGLKDIITRLGFAKDQIVAEVGWDDDVDEPFRTALETVIGSPVEEEDYSGITDALLLWWRNDDGDLTDALVDAMGRLEDDGFIVLTTPRTERDDAVPAADVEEALATAALHGDGDLVIGDEWRARKLVVPHRARR